jgi:hypothetical protein
MAFTRVANFLPSTSGFHFSNSFPIGTVYPVVTLPIVGTIAGGDAGNGLCGGFVLAALDLFLHTPRMFPPPNTDADRPEYGSTIFNYLSQRLIDSFGDPGQGLGSNVGRVLEWIQTSDGPTLGSGLRRRLIDDEWPKIKMDIDAGKPSPLSLVGAPARGILDADGIVKTLHHCHQVLAYAYEVNNANRLTLLVYDCNDPSNDNSILAFDLGNPAPPTPIAAPDIHANMSGGIEVRGFFRVAYNLRDPSAIAAGSASKWDWRILGKPATANIRTAMGALSVKDTPAAAQRPHVFVEGNDFNLWCDAATGTNWDWLNMNKPPAANLAWFSGAVTAMDSPTAAQRPHLFVVGNDGNLWCRWAGGGGAWQWLNMSKPPTANLRTPLGAVTVMNTPTAPQRPHVFFEGTDYNLWCRWSDGANWHWLNMGKPATANIRAAMGVVTVMDTPTAPQRAHLFVEGNDFNLWCRWSDGNNWNWLNMGKPATANLAVFAGAVTVMDTPTSAQRAHVFIVGNDNNLWCRWSDSANWHWLNMGKPPTANLRMPLGAIVVRDAPGAPQRPHVFFEGNDSNLWCRWSDGANWQWLNMGKPPAVNIRTPLGAVTVMDTPTSPQRPHVFFEGNDYNLWCRYVGK